MSAGSAHAFVERVAADPACAAELTKAETAEACRAVAQAAGFEFSEEELNAVRAELSDEQMNRIAAGAHYDEFFGNSWGNSWGNLWGEPS